MTFFSPLNSGGIIFDEQRKKRNHEKRKKKELKNQREREREREIISLGVFFFLSLWHEDLHTYM